MNPPARQAAGQNGQGEYAGIFDLAAEAAAVAADKKPFRFLYKRHQYEVPPQELWPIDAMIALEKGNLEEALPQLLGVEPFDQMRKAGLNNGEIKILFDKIAADAGMTTADFSPRNGPVSTRT